MTLDAQNKVTPSSKGFHLKNTIFGCVLDMVRPPRVDGCITNVDIEIEMCQCSCQSFQSIVLQAQF
jgi:hypothetical protein